MEYGSSKKCYSQIFLLFLPVIIDYSPKQNIKNNSMDKDLKKVVVLLNCTPKVGQVKHYPVIERVRYCTGLFPFNRALILLLL